MSLLKRFWFFKDLSLYFFANIMKGAIPFLVLPFLTLYLSTEEYGIFNVYTSILMLLLTLTGLGIPMIIGRNFHQMGQEDHARLTSVGLACIGLVCLFFFILAAGIFASADEFMSIPTLALLSIPALCFLHNIEYINKVILRQQQSSVLYVALEIGSAFLTKFGGLALVVFVAASWWSLLGATAFIYAVSVMLSLWIMLRGGRLLWAFDGRQAKDLIAMSWPLMPHALGGMIMLLSDRLILERMTGADSVGVYSVAAQVGTASLLYFNAFNYAWGPWMHRELNAITPEKKSLIVRYSYYYFLSALAVSLAGAVFAWLYITYLVDESYRDALPMAYWIIAGAGVYGCSYAITHYLIVLGKTGTLPLFTGIAATVNIILTVFLVGLNGPIGAAQATFAAYVLMFVLNFTASQIYFPMPWLSFWKKNI